MAYGNLEGLIDGTVLLPKVTYGGEEADFVESPDEDEGDDEDAQNRPFAQSTIDMLGFDPDKEGWW